MSTEASDARTQTFRRDIGDGMHIRGMSMQHGKLHHVIERGSTGNPARDRPGAMG
jgi:hypothetical protein